MSHIIIFDENGNEIGRSPEGDEPPVGGAAILGATEPVPDHPARKVFVNLALIAELLGIPGAKKKK